MKDLVKLTKECQAELESLGIKCGKIRKLIVNTRAKKQWGSCKKVSDGVFDISISQRLLCEGANDKAVKSTICHELLHTVEGCMGHKGKWALLANTVNLRLGYDIKRVTSNEEKGIKAETAPVQFKYLLVCKSCGALIPRQKATAAVMHPDRYRCGKCGGALVRKI